MFECAGCGAVLKGRRARRFCSNACQRAHQRAENIAAWLATGHTTVRSEAGHFVRRYLFEDQQGRCAICGLESSWYGLPLTFVLDHIDGNADHNARENLRLVCPNCDSQLPTYKSRNRGKGRHLRRQRYANGQSY